MTCLRLGDILNSSTAGVITVSLPREKRGVVTVPPASSNTPHPPFALPREIEESVIVKLPPEMRQ